MPPFSKTIYCRYLLIDRFLEIFYQLIGAGAVLDQLQILMFYYHMFGYKQGETQCLIKEGRRREVLTVWSMELDGYSSVQGWNELI